MRLRRRVQDIEISSEIVYLSDISLSSFFSYDALRLVWKKPTQNFEISSL
jgi:hypothetical protein